MEIEVVGYMINGCLGESCLMFNLSVHILPLLAQDMISIMIHVCVE